MNMRLLAALAFSLLPLAVLAGEPALGGNCAVCLIGAGKAVPGLAQHAVTFDRQVYRFPSAKEKDLFAADPVKYAPALGGDCVVCRVEAGARMPGKVEFATVHEGRAFLFPSAKERDTFRANPKKYAQADLGLGGHCAVCVVMAKKCVPGKAEFTRVYDGKRYLFPGAGEAKAFEAEPAKFVPALDGDCVVCLKDGGKRMAGSPEFAVVHEGRLYLFPDAGAQKKFQAAPATYASVDVAASGNCVVCRKLAGKDVPGKAEFASVYRGMRYLFPSAKERDAFDADPAAFAGK
jgi:YHS domain-containing protein